MEIYVEITEVRTIGPIHTPFSPALSLDTYISPIKTIYSLSSCMPF